jgi:hypothetical protein
MIQVYLGSAVSDIPNKTELPEPEVYPALLPFHISFTLIEQFVSLGG